MKVRFQFLFCICNQQVSANGNPYLGFNGIGGESPECLYSQMLFYPLEEQLNLPSILVKDAYILCFDIKIVSKKYQASRSVFRVLYLIRRNFLGYSFGCVYARKLDYLVAF
jgi:hypothetical protein